MQCVRAAALVRGTELRTCSIYTDANRRCVCDYAEFVPEIRRPVLLDALSVSAHAMVSRMPVRCSNVVRGLRMANRALVRPAWLDGVTKACCSSRSRVDHAA